MAAMTYALTTRRVAWARVSAPQRSAVLGDPPTLADILAAVAGGDHDSFSRLYDELSPMVFGLALKVTKSRALAEEVTQEVFVQVWRQADRFDPVKGNARSWLATIAHRRSVDVVRRSQSAHDREESSLPVAPGGDVAETIVDRDEKTRVRSALSSLTDLQREAIELAYYGGLTYREVAQRLDAPLGTVKTRMRDGLMKMRAVMENSHD